MSLLCHNLCHFYVTLSLILLRLHHLFMSQLCYVVDVVLCCVNIVLCLWYTMLILCCVSIELCLYLIYNVVCVTYYDEVSNLFMMMFVSLFMSIFIVLFMMMFVSLTMMFTIIVMLMFVSLIMMFIMILILLKVLPSHHGINAVLVQVVNQLPYSP